ncbi:hypothetical protein BABINDRAFT_159379 [Babjeviella inositovora NRRL Y-12698]|uniref:Large ribosomal subunit protein mL54 n=1 Tax=Babjeviella inositovora NRRL Y-12698 TaxID=984486 RepID=A0A1E3QZ99_9ASCO|nr:uncharacterized protein BABINDRAFT_159379 [Babjeviella inositovora NRRL Y-12698]ODQ82884.1 hypothetical protein BABINDRAFT_159379 [Babjeviella inositovora NRRL Y-12698]
MSFTLRSIRAVKAVRSLSTSVASRNGAVAREVKVVSSCPAGTPLNLKFKKSGAEPAALEDAEYPEWLWTLLDKDAQRAALSASDPIKQYRKDQRARNIKKIKEQNFAAEMK